MTPEEAEWLGVVLYSGVASSRAEAVLETLGVPPLTGDAVSYAEALLRYTLTPEILDAVHAAQVEYIGASSSPGEPPIARHYEYKGWVFDLVESEIRGPSGWYLDVKPGLTFEIRGPLQWHWRIGYGLNTCTGYKQWATPAQAIEDLWTFAHLMGLNLSRPSIAGTPPTLWEHLEP